MRRCWATSVAVITLGRLASVSIRDLDVMCLPPFRSLSTAQCSRAIQQTRDRQQNTCRAPPPKLIRAALSSGSWPWMGSDRWIRRCSGSLSPAPNQMLLVRQFVTLRQADPAFEIRKITLPESVDLIADPISRTPPTHKSLLQIFCVEFRRLPDLPYSYQRIPSFVTSIGPRSHRGA